MFALCYIETTLQLTGNQNQRVVTCGEDGQVRLWAQEGQSQSTSADADAMDVDGKKKKRKDKKKKDRFNPY